MRECKIYGKYLEHARSAGVKTHINASVIAGLFMGSIFMVYAFAFYMGSVWIYKGIYNHTYHRVYSSGDILSCFFGVVFGMFSVGMAIPNIKAITEGKVAGKMAFDIIDRIPKIDQDDPKA